MNKIIIKSRNAHLSEMKIIYISIYVLNIGSVDQNSISQWKVPITILAVKTK